MRRRARSRSRSGWNHRSVPWICEGCTTSSPRSRAGVAGVPGASAGSAARAHSRCSGRSRDLARQQREKKLQSISGGFARRLTIEHGADWHGLRESSVRSEMGFLGLVDMRPEALERRPHGQARGRVPARRTGAGSRTRIRSPSRCCLSCRSSSVRGSRTVSTSAASCLRTTSRGSEAAAPPLRGLTKDIAGRSWTCHRGRSITDVGAEAPLDGCAVRTRRGPCASVGSTQRAVQAHCARPAPWAGPARSTS